MNCLSRKEISLKSLRGVVRRLIERQKM